MHLTVPRTSDRRGEKGVDDADADAGNDGEYNYEVILTISESLDPR